MVVDDPTTMGDVVFFAFELTFGTGFMTENSTAYLHEIPGSSKASGSSRSINAARCDAAAITLVFRSAEWRIIPSSKCSFFFWGNGFPQWSIWTRIPAQQFSGGWSCWSLWVFLDPSDGSVCDLFQAFVDGILVVVNRAFRCTKSTPYRFSRCRALCFLEDQRVAANRSANFTPQGWMNIPFDHPENTRKQLWLKYHRKCLRNHSGMEKHLENRRND